RTMVSTSPPTSFTSEATSSSSFLVPDASTSLPPSAPSVMAVARPQAPDAPVTMATLPALSNSDSGWRSGADISAISLSRLEAERLRRIEHRHHPQRAALAVRPAPGEREEGAALAGDLVDIPADVFDAGDAVGHHDLVRRLPVRKVVNDVTTGFGEILVVEMRLRRPRPVWAEEGAERMGERLHIDSHGLDAALDDPFRGLLVEARRVGKVVRVVAVVVVAAGVDHHDVVLLDL